MKRRVKTTEDPDPPTLKFKFVADRFGHIPNSAPLKIEYARKADEALTSWLETVEELFGDASAAFEAAVAARILPQYPSWSNTKKALDAVYLWLGALLDGTTGLRPGAVSVVERALRDSVETTC